MFLHLKKIKKSSIGILVVLFIFTSCVKLDNAYDDKNLKENFWMADAEQMANGFAYDLPIPEINSNELVENISADSYYISAVSTKNTNFMKYKNPYKEVPIASLTKLMTALVVLKNCNNFDELYTVSAEAINLERNASKANLRAGDKVSVRDLLYGLMLPSGNDAAIVLAENLDISMENFLMMMNREANSLGALHSNFTNPHGLDDQYHYSTCYDLFLITRELLKYPLFREIANKKEYTAKILQYDNKYRDEIWRNTNYFVVGDLGISSNVSLVGGKTGFTSNAGNCLVVVSKLKATNEEYISVVLNATTKDNTYRNTNTLLSKIGG